MRRVTVTVEDGLLEPTRRGPHAGSASWMTPEFVLDAGALIGWERNDERIQGLVQLANGGDVALVTSCAVVAQVWRGGEARLARLLGSGIVAERPLDTPSARRIGALSSLTGSADVVDGHVASLALGRGRAGGHE